LNNQINLIDQGIEKMNKNELDTPVAIIDLDVMEKNISEMAEIAKKSGIQLRPHIKTHKVPEIASMQIKAGARGITCAKLGEAEVMVDSIGIDDVFIANLIVGSQKIDRLLKLSEKAKVIVGVDSVEVAQPISDYAIKQGLKVPVLIKIDVGLQRLGVPYGKPALELAEKIDKMKGLELEGIYTHEGHAYGVTDNNQIKSIALEAGHKMIQTAEMIREAGIEVKTVSVGSTPTVRTSLTIEGITEVRPGAYVFNDYFEMRLGVSTEYDCAFTIFATVISVPSEDRAVIDAGTKSYTSDKAQAFGIYGLIKGMPDVRLVRAYEEHGVINMPEGKLKVGDRIEIIPNHVCPVVNLFDEVVALRKDKVEAIWKVSARGKLM